MVTGPISDDLRLVWLHPGQVLPGQQTGPPADGQVVRADLGHGCLPVQADHGRPGGKYEDMKD